LEWRRGEAVDIKFSKGDPLWLEEGLKRFFFLEIDGAG
jgi:hypothetical protein